MTESETSGGSKTNTNTRGQTKGTGQSETIHKRLLFNPDEIGRIFGDRNNPLGLALLSGEQPLVFRRVQHYTDPMFRRLFDPHPDHPYPPTLKENDLIDQVNAERTAKEHLRLAALHQRERDAQTYRQHDQQRNAWYEARLKQLRHKIDLAKRVASYTAMTVTGCLAVFLLVAFAGYMVGQPQWTPER